MIRRSREEELMSRLMIIFMATLTGVASSMLTASAANADPYDCHVRVDRHYAYADCYNGAGEYRAVGKCDRKLWPDPTVYGPWVHVGRGSGATCAIGERAYAPDVQTR
jgi:hypothetical protein